MSLIADYPAAVGPDGRVDTEELYHQLVADGGDPGDDEGLDDALVAYARSSATAYNLAVCTMCRKHREHDRFVDHICSSCRSKPSAAEREQLSAERTDLEAQIAELTARREVIDWRLHR